MTAKEKEEVREFVERRNKVITAFIMEETPEAVKDMFDFMWQTGEPVALDSFDVLRLGIYWAAQGIIDIPTAVKKKAVEKCIEMGCNPVPLWERTNPGTKGEDK